MRILALDPGATTGTALLLDNGVVEQNQIGYDHVSLERFMVHSDPEVVVFESFSYQRRDKVDLRPVEMIGVIKYFCSLRNIEPISQTPSQAKKFWTDDKIRKIGLWVPSLKHAMDATRHLLYYMTFTLGDQRWMELLRD